MRRTQAREGGSNQLRIVGGLWRSRRVRFLDAQGLRPTPDRVRETLFNWLQGEVQGRHCLDVFAGSGALSFEALSRGAESALLLERDARQAVCLREEGAKLTDRGLSVLNGDSLQLLGKELPRPETGFDLVFLDPPFGRALLAPALAALQQPGLLAPQAWVYIETELRWADLNLPACFELYRETQAGLVHSFLTRYQA